MVTLFIVINTAAAIVVIVEVVVIMRGHDEKVNNHTNRVLPYIPTLIAR